MIAAHMDEIGFMVLHVDDDGFIRINPFGGFDPRVLLAQRVLVHGSAGESLRGVLSTASKPIHLLDRRRDQAAANRRVLRRPRAARRAGSRSWSRSATWSRSIGPAEQLGDRIIGKAMDDRVGVFVMIEALRKLRRQAHEADVVAVATTQEEVGLRGAGTSAFHVEPTIGIALDVTLALDIPGHRQARAGDAARRRRGDRGDELVADLAPEAGQALPADREGARDPAPDGDPAARRHRRRGDPAEPGRRAVDHALGADALRPHRQRDGRHRGTSRRRSTCSPRTSSRRTRATTSSRGKHCPIAHVGGGLEAAADVRRIAA